MRTSRKCLSVLLVALIVPTVAGPAAAAIEEGRANRDHSVNSSHRFDAKSEPIGDEADIDQTVWVEVDSETAQSFEEGDLEVIDRYFEANGGVNTDEVISEFPTEFNLQQFDDVATSSSMFSTQAIAPVRIEKNPHGCNLLPYGTKGVSGGVMSLHKRSSGQSGTKYGKIGWKPYTICLTAPAKITNVNLFYRTTIGGLWKPHAEGKTGNASRKTKYMQYDVEWTCQNSKQEDWLGRTVSTVTAKNGKTYVAQQHTNRLTEKCGIK